MPSGGLILITPAEDPSIRQRLELTLRLLAENISDGGQSSAHARLCIWALFEISLYLCDVLRSCAS
jgi:hypothetical protein